MGKFPSPLIFVFGEKGDIMAQKTYRIKNRSASMVVYKIPEEGIRREFAPGEVKNIPYDELVKLMYQPGGKEMMSDFLQLDDDALIDNFNINAQPEYYMSEAQVAELIKSGSYDAFLDCLDYAPIGVIDIVKRLAVSLPMNDLQKAKALKEKTGFDLEAALANMRAEQEDEGDILTSADEGKPRAAATANTGRRTNSNYKVVSKGTPNYKVVTK